MKFSNKDFFSKWDQIRRKLRIWSHLLKKSLMKNFMFCAVNKTIKDLITVVETPWEFSTFNSDVFSFNFSNYMRKTPCILKLFWNT